MSAAEIASREAFESLLSQEDILRRVLVHLVDSGLHECRRVCRQWRDVCNRLPLKLRFDPDTVNASTAQQFSNVVSLKVALLTESSFAEGEGFPHSWADTVTDLDLACSFDTITIPLVAEGFVNPSALRSLVLDVRCYNPSSMIETLKSLSNLTTLTLAGDAHCPANVHPIADLRELRSFAAVPALLANVNGEFLFAPTTRLTKLKVLPLSCDGYHSFRLEVLSASLKKPLLIVCCMSRESSRASPICDP